MSSLVTVAHVKALGRIDYDTHDTEIQLLINGAENYVEEYCDIRLTEATHTDERTNSDGGSDLFPENLPITAVTSVKDAWSADEVEDSDSYFFVANRIVKDQDLLWNEGELRWKITYTAGYTETTVPPGLLNAIIGLTLLAYNNPEGRKSQKDMGQSISWEGLATNDLLKILDQYSLYRYVE